MSFAVLHMITGFYQENQTLCLTLIVDIPCGLELSDKVFQFVLEWYDSRKQEFH